MQADQKLFKIDGPDDPDRCQGDEPNGQCSMKILINEDGSKIPGVRFCIKHNGMKQKQAYDTKRTNDYRLEIWTAQVERFSASEKITNIAGEIGIMRMLIEQMLNQCRNNMELLMHSSRISDLVMKCERLCSTFDKITNRQSNLLDKSAALVLAGNIVEIICAEIQDPDKVDRISKSIIDLVAKLGGKEIE